MKKNQLSLTKDKLGSIELQNFQSHKQSKLEFHPGINVIIGNSKDGKTAILRGIRQIEDNKPTGLGYNSYWNRDKKNQPIEEHIARLNFEDVSISRIKAKNRNDYELNGNILEAVGKGAPPEEITKALKIDSTNFQRQFDQPFLLNEGPAEIGRFFNKIVNLDLSDKVLAEAEKDRRNTVIKINDTEEEITKYIKELDGYGWIDKAEILVKEYEESEKKINEFAEKREVIFHLYSSLLNFKKEIENYNKIPFQEIENLLDEIERSEEYINGMESEWAELNRLNETLQFQRKELEKIESIPFDKIYGLLSEIETISNNIEKLKKEKNGLLKLQTDLDENRKKYGELRQEIRELEKEMPASCPACGRPF